jgi:threonine dehydrogenase-like Zn-dependent dehydrogenase
MGADLIVNTKLKDLKEEIMKMTNGDGIARIVEASGASKMLNMSFSLLRKVLRSSHSSHINYFFNNK